MYIPLNIPPGVYKNGTEYQSKGRWNASNLVRWYQNTLRPIGGWRKRSTTQLTGSARGLIAWRDNSNVRWTGIGTHSKLYAMNEGGVAYDITPTTFTVGIADADSKLGYGYGTYGSSSYGIARPDTGSTIPATTWSLDTWGEYLVGCSSADGQLLEWQLNTASKAVAITNAPTGCTGLITTEERFLFALGASGNPRRVKWSDQENNTVWTAAATNQAGDFDLTTLGSLMCAKRVRGLTILFTDVDVHSAAYIGPPYVYGFERIGTGCGVISKQAVAATDNSCIWMSRSGFWLYDGFVKPLPSDVGDYIFNNINYSQSSKIYCVHNSAYGEVWWFYPSAASTENDSYVSYNYREGHWAIGSFGRTCGTDSGVFSSPMMISSDSYVYQHEIGYIYDSVMPYAESGPIELAAGDRVINITGLVPDENTLGEVKASFATKFYPNSTEYSYGPYTMNTPTSVRITGRQIAVKIDGFANTNWRVGTIRLDGRPGGLR
tara:strand:- start:272 stop:1744 length:1473 start_codon:yes stop_codon:yes gene_type:complete